MSLKVTGRIVVVDDAQANLMLLANLLHEAGHEVRISNSAERALTLMRRQTPDLVLLDINLPDRDGFYVCREMKGDETLSTIPVIFLSAHDDSASRAQAFKAGGAEYLTKPFDSAEVLSRVAHHLQLQMALRELTAARKELSLIRSTSEATFTALCAALVGTTLESHYQLHSLTSIGPHSATFRAEALATPRPVSVRILLPTPEGRVALARLEDGRPSYAPPANPGLMEVLDAGVSESGVPYVVYAPEPGRTLADRLKGTPGPSIEEVVSTARSISEAVVACQAAGLAHGGLRPESVFLSQSDRGASVRLLDFGIGAMDDVFALAAVLKEMISSASSGVPSSSLSDWISRALDADAADRPSIAELVAVLAEPA